MKKSTVLNLVILGSGIFTAGVILKKKMDKKDNKMLLMNEGKVVSLSEINDVQPRNYIKLK